VVDYDVKDLKMEGETVEEQIKELRKLVK